MRKVRNCEKKYRQRTSHNKLSYNPHPPQLRQPQQQFPDPPIRTLPIPIPRPLPPLLQLLIRLNRRSPKMTPEPGFSGSSRPDSTARRIDRARRMKGCVAFSPDIDDVSRKSTPGERVSGGGGGGGSAMDGPFDLANSDASM